MKLNIEDQLSKLLALFMVLLTIEKIKSDSKIKTHYIKNIQNFHQSQKSNYNNTNILLILKNYPKIVTNSSDKFSIYRFEKFKCDDIKKENQLYSILRKMGFKAFIFLYFNKTTDYEASNNNLTIIEKNFQLESQEKFLLNNCSLEIDENISFINLTDISYHNYEEKMLYLMVYHKNSSYEYYSDDILHSIICKNLSIKYQSQKNLTSLLLLQKPLARGPIYEFNHNHTILNADPTKPLRDNLKNISNIEVSQLEIEKKLNINPIHNITNLSSYIFFTNQSIYNSDLEQGNNIQKRFLQSMSDSSSDSYAYTSDCNKYTDCFNCTMRSIDNYYFCAWNNGICTDKNMKRDDLPWYKKFQQCSSDISSISTMRKFCGEVLDRVLPFEARIKKINNYYGDKNLYCMWRAINTDPTRIIQVNITNLNTNINNKYFVEVLYYDGSTSFYDLNSQYFYIDSQRVANITFHFHSPTLQNVLPFLATFEISAESISVNYYNIFIIIGLVILACVILTVFFHRCSKIFARKAANQNDNNANALNNHNANNEAATHRMIQDFISEQNEYQNRLFLREEKKKKKNLMALEKLFSEDLKSKKFSENSKTEYCGNCTICLEDFTLESEVITLSCRHTFHLTCLKNWLSQILLNPKCPNCNDNILHILEESNDDSSSEDESSDSSNISSSYSVSEIHYNNQRNRNRTYSRYDGDNNRSEIIINRSAMLNRSVIPAHHRINNLHNHNNRRNPHIRILTVNNENNVINNPNSSEGNIRRNLGDEVFNNLTSISIDNRSINYAPDYNLNINVDSNNANIREIDRNRSNRQNTNNFVLGNGVSRNGRNHS